MSVFSDEEKARIRARAQELVASGVPAGQAAQQAVAELGLTQEDILARSTGQVSPSGVEPIKEQRTEEVQQVDIQLAEQETKYKRERSRQLKAQGLSDDQIETTIAQELENYRRPVALGYGEIEDREEGGLGRLLPLAEAPIADQQESSGIDYTAIAETFSQAFNTSNAEGIADAEAFKTFFVEPRLREIKANGTASGAEAESLALQESFNELIDMVDRLQNTERYLQPETVGSQDPWIRAFRKQVELGEGVPDLTPQQMAFLNAREVRRIETEVQEQLKEGRKKKVIINADGSESPYPKEIGVGFRLPAGARIEYVPKTKEDIQTELLESKETPWWLDPQKKVETIANPEDFEKRGFMSPSITPYGTTKESTASWLLKAAMTAFNIGPALISEAVMPDEVAKAAEEKRVERGFEPDQYILENIAFNEGAFNEAQQAAEALNITAESDPFKYYSLLTAGFAVDILDPSFDIARGFGVAAKEARRTSKQISKLYAETKNVASPKLREAAKVGFNDFLDNYLLTSLAKSPVGDPTNIVARTLSDDYTAAAVIKYGADVGDSKQQVSELLKNAGLQDTNVAKIFLSGGDDVAKAYDDITKLFADADAVKEIESVSKTISPNLKASDLADVSTNDLRRVLGSMARLNDDLAKRLRSAAEGKTMRLDEMVRILEPEEKVRLTKGLLYNKAAADALAARESIPSNLVALTNNTFASKTSAKQILEKAKTSEIVKVATELGKAEIKLIPVRLPDRTQRAMLTGRGGREPVVAAGLRGLEIPGEIIVLPAFKLANEQKTTLENALQDLVDFGKIRPDLADGIRTRLAENLITTKDLRAMIDANVDLIAAGQSATSRTASLRSRDFARLPVQQQVAVLEPLESRTFAKRKATEIYDRLTDGTPKMSNLPLGARRLVQSAQQKVSTLDVKLRQDVRELIKKGSPLREAYGIPADASLTNSEALAYLIVGPVRSFDAVLPTLYRSINDLAYSKETKENIFDVLTGTNVSKNTEVLTDAGQNQIMLILSEATKKIIQNPASYWDQLVKISNKIEELKKAPNAKEYFRYPVNSIETTIVNNKVPSELQVASYYRAEATRAVNEVLTDLIRTETNQGTIRVIDLLGAEQAEAVENILKWEKKVKGERRPASINNEELILSRIKKILNGEDTSKITGEDLASAMPQRFGTKPEDVVASPRISEADAQRLNAQRKAQWARKQQEAQNIIDNNLNDLEPLFRTADQIARNIIRKNDLTKVDVDIGELERLFDDLFSNQDNFAELRLLFGEDVAQQLQNEFNQNFDKLRSELIETMDSKKRGRVREAGKNFLTAIQNLRYFALLTLRPRFHAANLLTGAEVAYSTTGRIINPLDWAQGAAVIRNANPTKVMFQDAAGRSYTMGELSDMLKRATGRSVFKLDLPRAQANDIINFLEGRFIAQDIKEAISGGIPSANEVIRSARGTIGILQNIAQSEDLLFRYAILKKALQEGRSVDEATALARESLYDVGKLSSKEKQFKQLALFYGWARNNLLTALKNITSAKGLKRIKTVERTRQSLSDLFTDEETRKYSPSYAQTRILLDRVGFDPEKGKDLILTSPALTTLDGVYTLAEALKLNPEVLSSVLRPEYKIAFGVEDPFDRELKQVPPEHIALLDQMGFEPEDVINLILAGFGAEAVVSVPGQPNEGAINGSIYPLNSPKQKRAYDLFTTALNVAGASTPILDLGRIAGGDVTRPGEELALGAFSGDTARDIGGAGIYTFTTPQKQAYYDRLTRLRALRAVTSALRDDETKRMQEEAPVEEVQQAEEIKQIRQEIKTAKALTPTEIENRMLEIGREVQMIKINVRTGNMTPQEGYARGQELMKEYDELKRLQRAQ